MTHQVDLLLAEAVPQVVSHRQRVGYELLLRHRFGRDTGTVGEPSAALFPPDHSEVICHTRGIPLRQKVIRQASVQIQQYRMCWICALDEHPLALAVDIGKDLL
jgi:hypothetical protein